MMLSFSSAIIMLKCDILLQRLHQGPGTRGGR